MATQLALRTLAVSLVLVTGVAQAGLFGKKKQPPPPPPEPVVVAPVEPPTPPPPVPLEFSGIQTAPPLPASLDRLLTASPEVQATAQWVASTKNNSGLPFIVVDKVNAQIYAFTPYGQLKATAPILLGMGVGDVALVPQDAPMSAMPPAKRITPAGRYQSKLVNDGHKIVLLVDPANLITIHPVAKGTPAQRRAERLASVASDDNRISFGCVNVPPAFFTDVVDPDFRGRQGIVYILPEKTTAGQLFGFQPAGAPALDLALKAGESVAPVSAAGAQAAIQGAAAPAPVQVALKAEETPAPVPQAAPASPADTAVTPAPVAQ